MKLTIEERVHKICQLLSEGMSHAEICELVEHDHCDDKVFMSYISAIRNGVTQKEIASTYIFNRPTYEYVKKMHNSIFELTTKVSEYIEANELTNPEIVDRLYKKNEHYTEQEFYRFVTNTRLKLLKRKGVQKPFSSDSLNIKFTDAVKRATRRDNSPLFVR